jgi:transcriptional regulator with XRE-family HTH domain
MKGRKKTPKVAGFMRAVLAGNIRNLIERDFRERSNKPRSLAKDAGVSLSTIQRILKQDVGASLDNIEAIAAVFDLSVYQLLVPNLDVNNPQLVKGATKDEERMYRSWKRERSITSPAPAPGRQLEKES